MRKKTHQRVARELARLLRLDEDKVLLGATLPDLDTVIGVHRRTLHNPFCIGSFLLHSPDLFVGYLSHLVLDSIPNGCRLERAFIAIRRFVHGLCEEA